MKRPKEPGFLAILAFLAFLSVVFGFGMGGKVAERQMEPEVERRVEARIATELGLLEQHKAAWRVINYGENGGVHVMRAHLLSKREDPAPVAGCFVLKLWVPSQRLIREEVDYVVHPDGQTVTLFRWSDSFSKTGPLEEILAHFPPSRAGG